MKIVVSGSRHWTNEEQLRRELDKAFEKYKNVEIAHGASRGGGVDTMASQWAADRGVNDWPFPVRSGKTGIDGNHKGAPLNRNLRMLKSFMPDLVLAFRADGKSNGTDHTVREAKKLGIQVEIVHEGTS